MVGRAFLDPAAPACRFARTIAGAAENAREDIRLPVDHVGVAIAARRDQADVFGDWSMGRTGPLTIDDFVEIVGVRDIRRVQTLTSSVARPRFCCLAAVDPCRVDACPVCRLRCRDATPDAFAWKVAPRLPTRKSWVFCNFEAMQHDLSPRVGYTGPPFG